MTLRHIVPTMALAAAAVAPASLQALSIQNEDVELNFGIRLQTRIEFASASDAAGDDWDIYEGSDAAPTEDPKQINFQIRRARLYLKGVYKENTKFNLTFYDDEISQTPGGSSASSSVAVRYAYVGHTFKSDDIKHYVQFGLDKPQLLVAHTDSSSKMLFPNGRLVSGAKAVDRKIGLAYHLKAPLFNLYATVSEADRASDDDRNDLQLAIRAESSFKEEWNVKKRTESFLGKPGFHHQVGAGIGLVTDSGDDEDGATIFTVDYLAHWNQLTALAEVAMRSNEADSDGDGMWASVQGGWAIPMDNGLIVEPALRFQLVDDDDDVDDTSPMEEEGGESGTYIDAGVNVYLDGHSNKLQFAIQSFTAEEGDADAFVFRIAHQLNF